ncbi:hypothetical protein ABW19_dt0205180 [Dactylella cylindrospora]|nr:hypothetical protein ABW19_dt0205180 [Dactylella cylindrospora]
MEPISEKPETTVAPDTPTETKEIDYVAWDAAIVSAISSLPEDARKTRSQQFVPKHPTALSEFRALLSQTTFDLPLAPFQLHPTYLLRFMLAEWRDEELKEFRTDLKIILSKALERVQISQKWRSGDDECWKNWGYQNMDDMYANYRSPKDQDLILQKWYLQTFFGVDKTGHPVHYELLPNTYHEDLMTPLIARRILNNEKTLRERLLKYNPPLGKATPEQLANPIIGVTWVLDARQLSLFATPAMYKTMNGMMAYSNKYTSAHYPENGFRALVINLGSVLISIYNIAIKIMPAQTQRTTNCYGGREILDEIIGEAALPAMFAKSGQKKVTGLSDEETRKLREDGDIGHWIEIEVEA